AGAAADEVAFPTTGTRLEPASFGLPFPEAGTFGPRSTLAEGTPAAEGSVSAASARVATVPLPPEAVVAGAAATGALVVLLGLLSLLRRPENDLLVGTRRDVYELLKENPGLSAAEVAARTGLTHQTITYHLTVLTSSRLVVAQGRGARKFYFVNGSSFSPEERRLMSVIKDRETMEVLKLVVDAPGLCKKDLAERLGVSRQTVNWHLSKLEEAGLVAETKDGTSRHLAPAVPDLAGSTSRIAARLGDPKLSPWGQAMREPAVHGVALPPPPVMNSPTH
ncbi:MAG TPA: winged helix-turn-helix transcriptional regulator, partial [Candidatus Thermoplasmatota archaeon]|nr:winged helix-turn-helix transcriptional regulator [Candidatus Thermoplasmatota archaeon]